MERMFEYCLEYLNIHNFNALSITNMYFIKNI